MPDRATDLSYSPEDITVLPRASDADWAIVGQAYDAVRRMHPLNADAQYARVEEILERLTGSHAEEHRVGPLRAARETRDAMKRMGANRAARGWHPVPDHLQHLLDPSDLPGR